MNMVKLPIDWEQRKPIAELPNDNWLELTSELTDYVMTKELDNDYEDYILANISARDLQRILKSYPKAHQVVEVEAFVAANQLTSSDIEQVFKERCLS